MEKDNYYCLFHSQGVLCMIGVGVKLPKIVKWLSLLKEQTFVVLNTFVY